MPGTRPRYLWALSLYTIYLKNLRLSVKHGKHMGLLISFWNPTNKGDKRTKEVWTNKDKENASIDRSRWELSIKCWRTGRNVNKLSVASEEKPQTLEKKAHKQRSDTYAVRQKGSGVGAQYLWMRGESAQGTPWASLQGLGHLLVSSHLPNIGPLSGALDLGILGTVKEGLGTLLGRVVKFKSTLWTVKFPGSFLCSASRVWQPGLHLRAALSVVSGLTAITMPVRLGTWFPRTPLPLWF